MDDVSLAWAMTKSIPQTAHIIDLDSVQKTIATLTVCQVYVRTREGGFQ